MADTLLQRNDEAYARVEEVIDTIAFKLRLRHIKLDQTLAPRNDALETSRPALIGSVTRVIPHAFGIFAVQNHVHLYCRTTMRLQLFEEHLKEMLGLENLDVNGQDIKITIPHEQLARIGLALPNSLNLVFAHMGFDDFDTLSEGEQLPFSRLAGLLQDPLAALHLSSMYRELYLQVRDWAHRVGIVSPMGCMATEQDLLKYYTQGFLTHIEDVRRIVSSPLDGYKLFYKIIKSAGFSQLAYNAPVSPLQRMRMLRAISRVTPLTSELTDWTVDGLEDFVATSQLFIKIDASCWDVRQQGKLAQHRFIERTSERVSQFGTLPAADHGGAFSMAVYPEFSLPTGHLDTLTFLVAVSSTSPSYPYESAYVHVSEISRAILNPADSDGVGSTVRYEVMDRSALKEALGDIRVIAHNLPAVYALHLDYIPLIDPLAEEEAANQDIARIRTPNPSSDKFRTSQEVLNRLQWDTKHASNRYEVGYKDRFEKELLWKPLEEWTRDKQAEDFVPMHRIHRFREVGSAEVVWDREGRMDRTG